MWNRGENMIGNKGCYHIMAANWIHLQELDLSEKSLTHEKMVLKIWVVDIYHVSAQEVFHNYYWVNK